MSEIDKFENGELAYFTSIDGTVWHSDKIVQQFKTENEKLSIQNYYLNKANLELVEEKVNYLQRLNEIEHILEINKRELDECLFNDVDGQILQLIKQAKEGEK